MDTRSIHDRAAACRSTVFERDYDLIDLVSHVLPAACVSASPRCGGRQLWAFCRANVMPSALVPLDRESVVGLVRALFGKLVADRGYISSKLGHQLKAQGDLRLITKPRSNVKHPPLP